MPEPRLTVQQREQVASRAQHCCDYCLAQEQFSPDPFSSEHIMPLSKGGTNDEQNLAYSCQGCNNHKYVSTQAFDPATGELASLCHPRRDRWSNHFAWNPDCSQVLGLTPIGRATVEKLQLNRAGLMNPRKILFGLGLHPPQS